MENFRVIKEKEERHKISPLYQLLMNCVFGVLPWDSCSCSPVIVSPPGSPLPPLSLSLSPTACPLLILHTCTCYSLSFKSLKTAVYAKHPTKCECVTPVSLKQQEQDPTNLYISNLPVSMDEQELENMLKPFGHVISTRILRDANGLSRGVGFARMESTEKCDVVIQNFNGKFLKTPPGMTEPLLCKFADGGQKKRQSQVKYPQNGRPWTREGESGMALTYDPTTMQNGFYSSPYSLSTNRMIAQTSITPFIAASPVSTYQIVSHFEIPQNNTKLGNLKLQWRERNGERHSSLNGSAGFFSAAPRAFKPLWSSSFVSNGLGLKCQTSSTLPQHASTQALTAGTTPAHIR
ncbi:hypothetical protein CCH79_00007468 [Gambusia affinis]|uniref:RRM domain-containing protein n=1 Tax=Gambusia affinis TaxID=33528 RepID=A0A315WGH4_GAMAF|nr:hypothetical protein CCH79_00007468 [Gambusia affinis]